MLISESLMCTGVKIENTRLEGALGNGGINMCAGEEDIASWENAP